MWFETPIVAPIDHQEKSGKSLDRANEAMPKSRKHNLAKALAFAQTKAAKHEPKTGKAIGDDGRPSKKTRLNNGGGKWQGQEKGMDDSGAKERVAHTKRRKGTMPFRHGEKILLVGEGDFSFTVSLLLHHLPHSGPFITATSLETSLASATSKHGPQVENNIKTIEGKGGKVIWGVDARKLEKVKGIGGKGLRRKWDRIVWNFPHSGEGISDQDRNIRSNQALILQFLKSAAPLLSEGDPNAISIQESTTLKGKKRKRNKNDDDDDDHGGGVSAEDDSDFEWNEENDGEKEGGDKDRHNLSVPPPTQPGSVLLTLRTTPPYSFWSPPDLFKRPHQIATSVLPPPHNHPKEVAKLPRWELRTSWVFDRKLWEGYQWVRSDGKGDGASADSNEHNGESEGADNGKRKRGNGKKRHLDEGPDTIEDPYRDGGLVRTWEAVVRKIG